MKHYSFSMCGLCHMCRQFSSCIEKRYKIKTFEYPVLPMLCVSTFVIQNFFAKTSMGRISLLLIDKIGIEAVDSLLLYQEEETMVIQDFVEENEFAKEIHISVSRLKKWRKYYDTPYHRINRKIYYIRDEFWTWFYTDGLF